jgi:hypothetical protein
MADQKRWFKVWTSIVANAHFAEMSLEDIGRWTLLGAATALDGDRGTLPVPGLGKELCRLVRVDTLEAAQDALLRLRSVHFEEGKNGHDESSVTWSNWIKYQEDSTQAERQKKSRSKRRGEEKRGEEKRIPLRTPPVDDAKPIPHSILDALSRTPTLGATPRLRTPKFWHAIIHATGGRVEYGSELLKAEAWLTANPTRAPRKDLARFVLNWMTRAGERS